MAGHTHYFPHEPIAHDVWMKILKDCQKAYAGLPLFVDGEGLAIVHWDKDSTPHYHLGPGKFVETHIERIHFNGSPSGRRLGHEDFLLRPSGSGGFEFCRTARKPYDLLVCSCLIVYDYHSPETIKVSSDGTFEDWEPAAEHVARCVGAEHAMKFKMRVEFD